MVLVRTKLGISRPPLADYGTVFVRKAGRVTSCTSYDCSSPNITNHPVDHFCSGRKSLVVQSLRIQNHFPSGRSGNIRVRSCLGTCVAIRYAQAHDSPRRLQYLLCTAADQLKANRREPASEYGQTVTARSRGRLGKLITQVSAVRQQSKTML